MKDVGYVAAFLAGLASFLSPCVLPLMPGYLSFVSGISLEDLEEARGATMRRVLGRGLVFVAGFSAVFIMLGAVATVVGEFLQSRLPFLRVIAGIFIILFGLELLGVLRLRFLMVERRYQGPVTGGWAGAALLGMAFAFGWSPCIGPMLFSILAYASAEKTVWRGITLLAFYSIGLGMPFLLIGLGAGTFLRLLDRYRGYLGAVRIASGALMVAFGLLLVTGWMARVTGLLT